MAENKKETYVLTIENNVDNTIIKSLQKDNKELLENNQSINLDNETSASEQLKKALEQSEVTGGTHHTRKRRHNRRNIKSNTRKGHIYRTNHRRTHGKSSAHGKKQTRRIANR